MKNERGFTLVEMLVVLLIISVLILVTIPNVSKHFASIDKKGCEAHVLMVQAQVEAYKIEKNNYPTLDELRQEGYITETHEKCPGGGVISIEGGKVKGPTKSSIGDESSGS